MKLFHHILALLIAGLCAGCKDRDPDEFRLVTLRGETMGTYYSVTCLVQPDMSETTLHAGIRKRLNEVDREFSNWNPDSWVSRFNRAETGEGVPCPPHATEVLKLALELSRRTEGALDPTVSPLIELWGFGTAPASPQPPSKLQIREALERCGYQHLEFEPDGQSLSKRVDGIELNLSAVAKGYTVDLIADFLEKSGIENHLVNIGGEIRAKGRRGGDTSWQIGIASPLPDHGLVSTRLPMTRGAVATSGDSQRFSEHDGRRYSHLLDPRTGEPVDNHLRSVTITAPTCALADGLATACFVLGSEKGMALIESFPEAEGLFLLSDQGSISSSGWGKRD